jgi:hypothetical protein
MTSSQYFIRERTNEVKTYTMCFAVFCVLLDCRFQFGTTNTAASSPFADCENLADYYYHGKLQRGDIGRGACLHQKVRVVVRLQGSIMVRPIRVFYSVRIKICSGSRNSSTDIALATPSPRATSRTTTLFLSIYVFRFCSLHSLLDRYVHLSAISVLQSR